MNIFFFKAIILSKILLLIGAIFMTEINQKCSKVSEITSVEGSTVDDQEFEIADYEEVEIISKKLIEQNLEAYKKLGE